MRCRLLFVCLLVCLLVLLVESKGRNRRNSRALAVREQKSGNHATARGNRARVRGNRLRAKPGRSLAKNKSKSRRRKLNAAKKKRNAKRSKAAKAASKTKKLSSARSGAKFIRVPLDFKSNFVRTTDNLRGERAFLSGKYGISFATTSGTATLTNVKNMEYTCKMTIGTPAQKFTVLPDTGSSNIWVPGLNCKSKACKNHKRFKPAKSSTFVKNGKAFSITYGSGSVSGRLGQDTVRVAGLAVANQTFAMTTKEPGSTFVSADFDGILGLGYQAISENNVRTIWQNMCSQDVISSCVFSVCMKGGGSSTRGGELIFGSTDTSTYTGSNSYTYTPVTVQGYWQFKLQSVSIGSDETAGESQAICDTGTSLIAAPKKAFAAINKKIGCHTTTSGECWMKCSKKIPDITFKIGGTKFTMAGNKLKLKVKTTKGNTVCISAITYMETSFWILGDAFIRHFCVVFDASKNRIGFATTTS
ncbi:uncharacterized protein Dwil_GK11643 [Drosophila willistoni]|uniref:Peptidase A1 domain-containing protein n=1 Tax=Drosophila willistoni TaxID=7260 RepID=B4N9T6_DROWI|nr:pepsin-2B [Drosophila willistoni]EDW80651.1 uncharacterized protein Dwil_GK11643 [Drosophila willistoni]